MIDEKHIVMKQVRDVITYLIYNDDLPNNRRIAHYRKVFGEDPPFSL